MFVFQILELVQDLTMMTFDQSRCLWLRHLHCYKAYHDDFWSTYMFVFQILALLQDCFDVIQSG
jgi:hypothetical protein